MDSETSSTSRENRSNRENFKTGENMLTLPPSHTPSFSTYRAGVKRSDRFKSL